MTVAEMEHRMSHEEMQLWEILDKQRGIEASRGGGHHTMGP